MIRNIIYFKTESNFSSVLIFIKTVSKIINGV